MLIDKAATGLVNRRWFFLAAVIDNILWIPVLAFVAWAAFRRWDESTSLLHSVVAFLGPLVPLLTFLISLGGSYESRLKQKGGDSE